jgi:hypothetical protein
MDPPRRRRAARAFGREVRGPHAGSVDEGNGKGLVGVIVEERLELSLPDPLRHHELGKWNHTGAGERRCKQSFLMLAAGDLVMHARLWLGRTRAHAFSEARQEG